MIMMNREVYGNSGRKKRAEISKSLVAFFRAQNPAGRFLEMHPKTGDWYDIGDRKAVEKTSQALRGSVRKEQQLKEPSPLNLAQEQAVAVLQDSHAEAYRQMSDSLPLDSVSSPLIEMFFRGMSSTEDENQRLESQENKKELSTTIKQNGLPLECHTSEDVPSSSQEHNSHHECVSSKILQLKEKSSVLSCGDSSSKSNISSKHAKRRTREGDSSAQEAPQSSRKRTRTATPPNSSNPNQGTTSEQISGEQSSARDATALAAISETGDVIAKLSSKIKELEQENYLLRLGFNTYQQKYENLRMKYENQYALIKLASSVAADNNALADGGGCACESCPRSLLKKKENLST